MVWEKESDNYVIPSYASVKIEGQNSALAGVDGIDKYGYAKINKDKIAISPNGDGYYDELIPSLYLFRSAKSMSVDILDFDNFATNTNYSKKDIKVTGRVSAKTKTLKITGNDVEIKDDRSFEADVKLNEGVNIVTVYAADKDGNELANYGVKIFCDVTAPVITLTSPLVNGGVINASSHKLELKGTVSDNFQGYEFRINGEEVIKYENDAKFGPKVNTKEFTKELNVNDGDIITLKAVDLFGNETVNKYTVKINPSLGVSVDNVTDGGYYNKDVTPNVKYNADLYDVTITVNGQPYENGQTITAEGSYTLAVKSVLKGEDKPQGIQEYKFTIDKTAPVVKINGMENGKAYNKDVLPKIEVEEGAVVTSITLDGKAYDGSAIIIVGKHVLEVTAVDLAGNISEKIVVFNISAPKPEDPNKNPGNSQDKPNPGNNQSKPGTGNTSSSISDNSKNL
ncbi:hypothetical protein [Inconstantimicrobium porci]|uniref:Cadherin-like beta sandwich domain-containing protein n=1 Tax=Inconstantimicrobium porci TaxID=2652291 RepID=A0A7X2T1X8_9CLOT|nr:hypothetical protein [Inconstantimicrobium porci]MSR92176.1 cadherin-like beta sandwich domain-containing protein [Inconstantimicrobium porci]